MIFSAATHPALHPLQSAEIKINGESSGWIGVLHPRLMDALDLTHEVVLFELTVSSLTPHTVARYKTISKYPQIRRDLSFLIDEAVSAEEIESKIRTVEDAGRLKGIEIFDVYKGKGIPDGKKSLAIAMTLQDDHRTLVDAEINALIGAIIKT